MPALDAFLDCPACAETFAGSWPAGAPAQELAEAPVAEQRCPACGHAWPETWPGWSFYTEAG